MSDAKASNHSAPTGQQFNDGWLQTTPGERFKIRIRAEETQAAYTMLEMVADPRNGVPMHIHKNEDEYFIVLEGTLHIVNGDKRLDAPAGTSVTVNKGIPHAWCNLSQNPLRMLVIFSPGHIEGLFRQIAARQSDDIAAILENFGCLIVGPTLLEDLHSIKSPRW